MGANKEVAAKLSELERKAAGHDEAIRSLVQAIRQLMAPSEKAQRSIDFRVEETRPRYRTRWSSAGSWSRPQPDLRPSLRSQSASFAWCSRNYVMNR